VNWPVTDGVQGEASFEVDGFGPAMNGYHLDGFHHTHSYSLEIILHARLLERCEQTLWTHLLRALWITAVRCESITVRCMPAHSLRAGGCMGGSPLRTLERERATVVFVPYYGGLAALALDQRVADIDQLERSLLDHLKTIEPDFYSPQPSTTLPPHPPPSEHAVDTWEDREVLVGLLAYWMYWNAD
jgi:hypothetical protein